MIRALILTIALTLALAGGAIAQTTDEKAEAVLTRAVTFLGGNNYVNVKTLYSTG